MNAEAGRRRFNSLESLLSIGLSASVGCVATTSAETIFGGADGMMTTSSEDYQFDSCTSPT